MQLHIKGLAFHETRLTLPFTRDKQIWSNSNNNYKAEKFDPGDSSYPESQTEGGGRGRERMREKARHIFFRGRILILNCLSRRIRASLPRSSPFTRAFARRGNRRGALCN